MARLFQILLAVSLAAVVASQGQTIPDTPEVAQAKREHFAAVEAARQRTGPSNPTNYGNGNDNDDGQYREQYNQPPQQQYNQYQPQPQYQQQPQQYNGNQGAPASTFFQPQQNVNRFSLPQQQQQQQPLFPQFAQNNNFQQQPQQQQQPQSFFNPAQQYQGNNNGGAKVSVSQNPGGFSYNYETA